MNVKCECTGCNNIATHTWCGLPTCNKCSTNEKRRLIYDKPFGEKPVTKVKVEYVQVDDSIFSLNPDFMAGELYKWEQPQTIESPEYIEIESEKDFCNAFLNENIYRKVETPVTWEDELIGFLSGKSYIKRDGFAVLNNMVVIPARINYSDFLSMCHLVASLTDNPNE